MICGVFRIPRLVKHNAVLDFNDELLEVQGRDGTNKIDWGSRRVAGKSKKSRMGAWMRRVSKGRDLLGA
jgi:hypothetical protein